MNKFLYDTRSLFFSFKSFRIRFFGSNEGGSQLEKNLIDFFHVSEHVDQFKAIKVFSLRKNPKITGKVWSGGTPPPLFGKTPNFYCFFLMKVSLT